MVHDARAPINIVIGWQFKGVGLIVFGSGEGNEAIDFFEPHLR